MAMKTLTELDAEQEALRERARVYELLIGERDTLQRAIAKYEPMVANTAGVEALRTIHQLCAEIPKDLPSHGSRFAPGGFESRDLIMTTAGDALNDLTRKRGEIEQMLFRCREKLTVNAAKLKEFEN